MADDVTPRVLNRTLLARQHLLERLPADDPRADPVALTAHLLGLQAQEPMPPYLSVAARADADPRHLSRALAERSVLRVLPMRGTIHTVTADDARLLRPLVQPFLDKVSRNSGASRPAAHVPLADLLAEGRALMSDGPVPVRALGAALAERFTDAPPSALVNRLREGAALVQVPPRGLWGRPGGVAYVTLESWLGEPDGAFDLGADPAAETEAQAEGLARVVRRYLAAFGPATPADVTTWSGITGVRAVFDALGDELVPLRTDDGRTVWDLAGAPLTDADVPAPVRFLGRYDNVWLSHAGRDRVTPPDARRRWMGSNGGVGSVVLVDGVMAGLWSTTAGGEVEVELFDRVSRAQRSDLDAEAARVEALLAVPADEEAAA
ncbi:winged helix DNA-binding domain-containing protein [Luteimicrobium sp. NPDC057192]|uniref:winged helix DNA-binding domain-containing protein n=1 Tax=Luteimicrobium sp. NPDC057192 TaxID=3346042 RepID=UPI003641396B